MSEVRYEEEFKQVLKTKRDRAWNAKLMVAKRKYLKDKRNGGVSMVVDEWDEFEKYRDEVKIEEIIKRGEDEMKFNVLVRLTKNYNVAEFSATDCETVEDVEYAKNFCRTQAEGLLSSYALDGATASKETYTKQTYPTQPAQARTPQGKVTVKDITTQHGTSKQHGFLVQGINKGILTLEQVNNAPDYDTISGLVSEFFAKNKRK